MAQEWLAENIELPVEGSLRYQMEKRNIEEEQVEDSPVFPFKYVDSRFRSEYRNRKRKRSRRPWTPSV
jgi:hypothetical protein